MIIIIFINITITMIIILKIVFTVTMFSFQSSKTTRVLISFCIPTMYPLMRHKVYKSTIATNILKPLKTNNCIYLFISASEDSRRLKHTDSTDFSIFVFLELFGMAPVMHLDLFLSELLSSDTTSPSFSELRPELFAEVSVPSQKMEHHHHKI